jgi:hypothetical protein
MFEVIYPVFGFSGYKMTAVNLLYLATEHNSNVEISYRRSVYVR